MNGHVQSPVPMNRQQRRSAERGQVPQFAGTVPDLAGIGQQQEEAESYPPFNHKGVQSAAVMQDILVKSALYIEKVVGGLEAPDPLRVQLAMKFLDDAQMSATISPASPIYQAVTDQVANYHETHPFVADIAVGTDQQYDELVAEPVENDGQV